MVQNQKVTLFTAVEAKKNGVLRAIRKNEPPFQP
jgi:hypothetical protein